MDKSQGLLSALEELKNNEGSYTIAGCQVKAFLEEAGDDRKKYEEIFDNKSLPATQIAMVLQKHSVKLSKNSIRSHRNRLDGRGCKCPIGK
jgi:hypothetical protein